MDVRQRRRQIETLAGRTYYLKYVYLAMIIYAACDPVGSSVCLSANRAATYAELIPMTLMPSKRAVSKFKSM